MTGRYRLEFAPAGDAHGRQVEERWMAPFTREQRADYLARYVEQGQQQAQVGGRGVGRLGDQPRIPRSNETFSRLGKSDRQSVHA